jgi:hypothetical protein
MDEQVADPVVAEGDVAHSATQVWFSLISRSTNLRFSSAVCGGGANAASRWIADMAPASSGVAARSLTRALAVFGLLADKTHQPRSTQRRYQPSAPNADRVGEIRHDAPGRWSC